MCAGYVADTAAGVTISFRGALRVPHSFPTRRSSDLNWIFGGTVNANAQTLAFTSSDSFTNQGGLWEATNGGTLRVGGEIGRAACRERGESRGIRAREGRISAGGSGLRSDDRGAVIDRGA